jgi:hypothetical protein
MIYAIQAVQVAGVSHRSIENAFTWAYIRGAHAGKLTHPARALPGGGIGLDARRRPPGFSSA